MLQTLYARAAHSKRPEHKFYDAKAIEIVEELDYDFSKAQKDMAMSAGPYLGEGCESGGGDEGKLSGLPAARQNPGSPKHIQ